MMLVVSAIRELIQSWLREIVLWMWEEKVSICMCIEWQHES